MEQVYSTPLLLLALNASHAPDRPNDGGLDFNRDGYADPLASIAQDIVDWLVYAQIDAGLGEGGWHYGPFDNRADPGEQSISGHVVLGLAAGEACGCHIPAWAKSELSLFVRHIQCGAGQGEGDADDRPGPEGERHRDARYGRRRPTR